MRKPQGRLAIRVESPAVKIVKQAVLQLQERLASGADSSPSEIVTQAAQSVQWRFAEGCDLSPSKIAPQAARGGLRMASSVPIQNPGGLLPSSNPGPRLVMEAFQISSCALRRTRSGSAVKRPPRKTRWRVCQRGPFLKSKPYQIPLAPPISAI